MVTVPHFTSTERSRNSPWKDKPLFILEKNDWEVFCPAADRTELEVENGIVSSNWEIFDSVIGYWLLMVYNIIRLFDEYAVQ